MSLCSQPGCNAERHGDMALCAVHLKHAEWRDNTDIDRMGIVRFSLDLFPQRINTKYGVPFFHREIYGDLLHAMLVGENKLQRLHAIQAPREHSKSTIISFIYVMYCILFQRKKYIVLISESYEKSVQFIRAIKRALRSHTVQYYFGNITAENAVSIGGKWTEGHIVTSTGVTIMAMGMGKSARGLIEEMRPDLIIADDAESENNTKTEEVREGNWQWWNAQVVPAADVIDGQCVYIGTMVHYDCILARLLEQDNGYHKRFYQVWKDQRMTQPLWPEKFPPDLIHAIEKMYRADPNRGASLFYMEYMGVAVDPDSRTFGPSTIRMVDFEYFDEAGDQWIRHNGETLNCVTFLGVDPASSLKKTSNYTCILAIAVDTRGRIFMLEYELARMPQRTDPDTKLRGQIETILDYTTRYRPLKIGYARTGVGLPIVQALRGELRDHQALHPAVGHPMLVEILETSDVNKLDRIRNVLESPHKLGKVYMRSTMVEHATAMEQFPKCRQFDSLDAMTNAVLVMHPPYVVKEYSPTTKYAQVVMHPYPAPRHAARDWEVVR